MSLWIGRKRTPLKLDLERFRGYEFFHDALDQYADLKVPRYVTVRYEPLKKFLQPLDGDPDEEQAFVGSVAARIENGEDVPPLVRDGDEIFDGRHRAWAAHQLGMKVAPVIDVAPFWTKKNPLDNPLSDQILQGFAHNEDDERVLVVGGAPQAAVVMVDLHAESRGGRAVYFENLYSLVRGGGRRTMELILRRADALGITVYIAPDPELPVQSAGIRMSPKRLRKWYAGFGFSPVRGSDEMVRFPKFDRS